MTGDPENKSTPRNGKSVPQFAPNFTVYALPPDVVCLYSEDRKFLLHGELYCALASAIGKGKKSFRELVRDLEKEFPSDKIPEAIGRPPLYPSGIQLFERRRSRLLGEPRPVAGDRAAKSPEMPRTHSIN